MYALTKKTGELEANEWFKNYHKVINSEELLKSFKALAKRLRQSGNAQYPIGIDNRCA